MTIAPSYDGGEVTLDIAFVRIVFRVFHGTGSAAPSATVAATRATVSRLTGDHALYLRPRGPLAQLGERRLCTAEVADSNPTRSTNDLQGNRVLRALRETPERSADNPMTNKLGAARCGWGRLRLGGTVVAGGGRLTSSADVRFSHHGRTRVTRDHGSRFEPFRGLRALPGRRGYELNRILR
jgi:hypothetical protein